MAINKKNSSTTKVANKAEIGLTYVSSAPNTFPMTYSDDSWIIVESGSTLYDIIRGSTSGDPSGSYAESDVIELIAGKIIDIEGSGSGSISKQIDDKINTLNASKSGTSNGVTVTVGQVNGFISSVNVTAPNFADTYDTKGAASSALTESKQYTNEKVNALDTTITSANNGVTVTLSQKDGLVSGLTVTSTLIGSSTDAATADTIYGAKKYTDNALDTAKGYTDEKFGSITTITGTMINGLFS